MFTLYCRFSLHLVVDEYVGAVPIVLLRTENDVKLHLRPIEQ